MIDDVEAKIYNYGVKKYNAFIKERKAVGNLEREAKEIEDITYHKQLGKELKNKAIARAKVRAKYKAYYPSKTSQITRVAEELSQVVRIDGPDPFGLFGNSQPQRKNPAASNRGKTVIIIQNGKAQKRAKKKKHPAVRDDYFDNLP